MKVFEFLPLTGLLLFVFSAHSGVDEGKVRQISADLDFEQSYSASGRITPVQGLSSGKMPAGYKLATAEIKAQTGSAAWRWTEGSGTPTNELKTSIMLSGQNDDKNKLEVSMQSETASLLIKDGWVRLDDESAEVSLDFLSSVKQTVKADKYVLSLDIAAWEQ